MTIEEKAKAYDEALERAKKYNIVKLIFPELAKSEDEKIRKEMIRYFTEMKKGGSAALPYDDCIAYLERQKEIGIRWLKSDNVKNPDKPYIDKAGMFYTTDGKMCHASEIEKQKGQKPTGWSEKDEHIIKNIYDFVKENTIVPYRVKCAEECLEWLKSLPERFILQPKQEQEEIVLHWESGHPEPYKSVLILRHGNVVVEGEWDKKTGRWYQYGLQSHLEDNDVEGWMDKKSLLPGNFNFHPSWKPSEEQMEALKEAAEHSFYAGEGAALRTLYNDLQKRYGTC